MNPDPEAVLQPLPVKNRIHGLPLGERYADAAVALPEHHRVFDSGKQIVGADEFEVDVEEGRPVQADQKPRLAHVLPSEGGEQRSQSLCERLAIGGLEWPCCRIDQHHEVQVGVVVQAAGCERSARGQTDERWSRPATLHGSDQEVA